MRDDDFILGLCSEYRRIIFLLAEVIHGIFAEILNLQISWQAQYMVKFLCDICYSVHCKCRCICDAGLIMRFILRDRRNIW